MKPITYYWQSLNFVSVMLAPISFLFCFLVSLRKTLYQLGILKSSVSPIPVIVVGNIYIGGNGKTPFVIWLAEQLKSAGYKPGIVSRGYGALDNDLSWPRLVDLKKDIQLFGDEPFLIHQSTQCPVIIDPKRNNAVEKMVKETGCDVIISDDGLQHYAMSRFIEINISDAKRLYGNGLCLPAGPLREREGRLKSVDYIVYNISSLSTDSTISADSDTQISMLSKQYDEKSYLMSYELDSLKPLSANPDESMTLSDLKGKIVHAVAGIGEPEHFFNMLRSYGLKVIEHSFADHHQYQVDELIFDEPLPIIMTEKDAVKCFSFSLSNSWYLPIKAKIDSTPTSDTNRLISKILNQLKLYKPTS